MPLMARALHCQSDLIRYPRFLKKNKSSTRNISAVLSNSLGIYHTGSLSAAFNANTYLFPHLSLPTEESHAYRRVIAHGTRRPKGPPCSCRSHCLSAQPAG